jgi:hypothetical protein
VDAACNARLIASFQRLFEGRLGSEGRGGGGGGARPVRIGYSAQARVVSAAVGVVGRLGRAGAEGVHAHVGSVYICGRRRIVVGGASIATTGRMKTGVRVRMVEVRAFLTFCVQTCNQVWEVFFGLLGLRLPERRRPLQGFGLRRAVTLNVATGRFSGMASPGV